MRPPSVDRESYQTQLHMAQSFCLFVSTEERERTVPVSGEFSICVSVTATLLERTNKYLLTLSEQILSLTGPKL